MTNFFIATQNEHKLNEIRLILNHWNVQKAYSHPVLVEETGLTFVENALIKARHAASIFNAQATKSQDDYFLADDSGLIVPCINHEPGVYSARYGGENTSDEENRAKLLERLKGIPLEQRQAYFYCAIVVICSAIDPTPLIFIGRWDGIVLDEKRGQHGFGYDPIFYLPHLKMTAAELAQEEKNRLSHRGQALQKLADYFNSVSNDNNRFT